jgi:hypothetical protein
LLRGSGLVGTTVVQEGQPVPDGAPGELVDFFGGGRAKFNDLNQYAFTLRARNGDLATKQKGMFYDGANFSVVRQESDPAVGLLDLAPNPSGDELFGNSFGSFHPLNSGEIGSHDDTITNIHSSRRPALFYGDKAFRQVNVSSVEGNTWTDFDFNRFYTTPDGNTWCALGDIVGGDQVLAVNDAITLRAGQPIGTSSVVVTGVNGFDLIANGDVYARGNQAVGDWAALGDELLAATGEPITTGAEETWGETFLCCTGNENGDNVVCGTTVNIDPAIDSVVVLSGERVVVREGDPVDLDGNGVFDDDVFIGRGNPVLPAFQPDDMFLTNDGFLYFFAPLRDGAGNDLGTFGTGGDAFLRVRVLSCAGDLDLDGQVGFTDLTILLSDWGPCPGCPSDLDGDDDVGFTDLTTLLAAWGPCD